MIYRLARLAAYVGRREDLHDEGFWLDLLDDFGPALSRFLVAPGFIKDIPSGDPALDAFRRSLEEHPLRSLKPRRTSVWILFAFKGAFAKLPAPFRSDGILLPFEWRRTDEVEQSAECARIPSGLVDLSKRVKCLLGVGDEEWVLVPDRCFQGQVDFCLDGATFESGWGALAAGLARALDRRLATGEWPFSSIAWNFDGALPASVGELARKFRLAADFGAEELAVAPEQRREAGRILAQLKAEERYNAALRRLRIYDWRFDDGNFMKSVRRLCFCNAYHRARRLLRLALFNLGVFMVVLAVVGAYAWDATRETVEYYGDYVENGGGVVGLFQLQERPDQTRCYEFRRQGWTSPLPWRRGERLLRSMRYVNADGEPREDVNDLPEHRRFSERCFFYDEHGVLTMTQCLGAGGKSLGSFQYSGADAGIADVVQGGNRHIDGYAFAAGGDRVRRLKYVRGTDGAVAEIRFVRNSGDVAAEDAAGVSRVAFERDELGRIVSKKYRDWQGGPVADRNGVHLVRYRYEGAHLASARSFAVDGSPRCGLDGGDEIVYAYSDAGNLLRRTVLAAGTKVGTKEFSYAPNGDWVSERLLVEEGRLRKRPWAERRIAYDAKGNVVCESWLDDKGTPLTRDSGCPASIRRAYDGNGLLVGEARYDEQGRLFAVSDGWARRALRSTYSADGTTIDRRYFGEDDRPTLAGKDRIAGEVKRFDAGGRLVGWELFGVNGEPVEGAQGWHRAELRYDREGRREKVNFFDRNGRPTNEKD